MRNERDFFLFFSLFISLSLHLPSILSFFFLRQLVVSRLSPCSVNITYSANADCRRHQKQENIYLLKSIVGIVFFCISFFCSSSSFHPFVQIKKFDASSVSNTWHYSTITTDQFLYLSFFFVSRMYPSVPPSNSTANVAQSNWYNMVSKNVSYICNLSWFHTSKLFINHAIIKISRRILQIFYSMHCKCHSVLL